MVSSKQDFFAKAFINSLDRNSFSNFDSSWNVKQETYSDEKVETQQ